ncbi:MAG: DUF6049 family protein [Nostocoides sp.]
MARWVARLAAATAALGSVLLLPALASPSSAGPPAGRVAAGALPAATAADALAVRLVSLTPAVVQDGGPVVVVASVRNNGTSPADGISVAVREGTPIIATRAQVAAWAAGREAALGGVLAKATVPGTLAPGATADVTLTVHGLAAGRLATWGAVPVSIEAAGGTASGRVHSFLGYQSRKEYVPLTTAIALPLVLDTDPALSGASPGRAAAWTAAASDTSRLGRILLGAAATSASLIVDPVLTMPAHVVAADADSTTPTSSPTAAAAGTTGFPTLSATRLATYAGSTAEVQARARIAARIDGYLAGPGPGDARTGGSHDELLLPMGDPDVAVASIRGDVSEAVRAAAVSSDGVAGSGPTLAWAADGAWTAPIESTVRAAYGPDLRVALVSSAWVRSGDQTASGMERSASGVPLAVYDAPLSGLLGRTGRTGGGGSLALQQFVADSAALVGERAGTARNLLVVGPRDLDAVPSDLNVLLTGIDTGIPWLTSVGARAVVVDGSAAPAELPLQVGATEPPAWPPSPLAGGAGGRVAEATSTIGSIAAVRGDGATFAPPWLQAGQRLLATSWRTATAGWSTLATSIRQAATAGSAGVFVSPRQINFLADSGRVQITVINNLDVAVHDLTLTLRPENPRLRITDPSTTVSIGARSRTTRAFRATALAAGSVPITATLSAPDGTVIRTDAPVRIRVTPTGDWMYWALGAIAGTILVVGIWRGLRRGRPRAAAPTPEDATP